MFTEAFLYKKRISKEADRPKRLYTILAKNDKLWRHNKTEVQKEIGLEAINCGKVSRKYMRETSER